MILFKQASALKTYIEKLRKTGKTIGFVPTMGALHNGHLSLIKTCKQNNDITIASIFVNPTQFNDKNDFDKYPVTIADDILMLETHGSDILFMPSVNEIYPDGTVLQTQYDLGAIEKVLEGAYRPGHFQGVCQVVERLLRIVQPDNMMLGQKDYQQCKVVERLLKITQLDVKLIIGATQREESGLAMSSRNMRLNDNEKISALTIYQCLCYLQEAFDKKPFDQLIKDCMDRLLANGFSKVDYVSIADADTLEPAVQFAADKKYVALIAASIGDVRLIDNMLLT